MKRITFLSVVSVLLLLFFSGCEKVNVETEKEKSEAKESEAKESESKESETNSGSNSEPEVTTGSAEKMSLYFVSLTGSVSGAESTAQDFEYGIEYSTDTLFSEDKTTRQKVYGSYSENPFTVTVTNAESGQKYFYRAYCISDSIKYNGEVKDFNYTWDVAEVGSENGYRFVDLGLTVKWATFNVGATKPEEYGGYYAWGETEPKTVYKWDTYKWCDESQNSLTKYCNDADYGFEGFTDTLKVLAIEDDVAHVERGGNWRMPTSAELEELWKHCEWVWYDAGNTEFNGVAGFKVTSFKEGYEHCFIFLPAAGKRSATSLYDDGSYAGYWSSSLYSLTYYAEDFSGLEEVWLETGFSTRENGMTIRPVCP